MSCCGSGLMGCTCEPSNVLMSGLYGLGGVNSLMGALVAAGSRVRVGFEYQSNASIAQHNAGEDSAARIQQTLTSAMIEFGIFTDAFVQVKEPGWFGLANGYITVIGTIFKDVGDLYDIGTQVLGLIQDFLPILTVTRRDAVGVDYIPPSAVNKPNVQQVYDPGQQQTQNQSGQPPKPGECSWSKQSFGDFIACELGITSPIGGVGVGAVGALVAVGIGTLILVAVLRR